MTRYFVVAVLSAALLMSGCGSAPPPAQTPASPPAAKPTEKDAGQPAGANSTTAPAKPEKQAHPGGC